MPQQYQGIDGKPIATNTDGLSAKEADVLKLLATAFNRFAELQQYRRDDIVEMASAVHKAQDPVLRRLSFRAHPEMLGLKPYIEPPQEDKEDKEDKSDAESKVAQENKQAAQVEGKPEPAPETSNKQAAEAAEQEEEESNGE